MPLEPEDSESSSQTKRAACNRCHAQKLRCVRDPMGSRSCVRCRRKGSKCVYEPPRKMGRPRAQSSTGDDVVASENALQGGKDTVAAAENISNPPQQWRNSSLEELRHHSVSTTGDDLALPIYNDFAFLDTPPPSLMSPSQLSDRMLSMNGPFFAADDFDLNSSIPTAIDMDLEPFQGPDHVFDPRAIPETSERRPEPLALGQNPSIIPPTPNEDEQIQTLSNLSLTLFQCNRSLACSTSSSPTQDPLHALHTFSLCSLIPTASTHPGKTSPPPPSAHTNSNNSVQIDKLLEHTRTLKRTLKALWLSPQISNRQQARPTTPHRPSTSTETSCTTTSTDQATTLLGLSCYLRLLQTYNTLLDNLSRSLKLLRAPPPATIPTSEIRLGCFALSSTQSLQLVLYLISQLLTELQYVIANRRCVTNNDIAVPGWNILAQQQSRFPGDMPAHHPFGVPPIRQESDDGLEKTARDIMNSERCVQEKIRLITIELHCPSGEGVGFNVA